MGVSMYITFVDKSLCKIVNLLNTPEEKLTPRLLERDVYLEIAAHLWSVSEYQNIEGSVSKDHRENDHLDIIAIILSCQARYIPFHRNFRNVKKYSSE